MQPLSFQTCSDCGLCRRVTAAAGSQLPVRLSLLLAVGNTWDVAAASVPLSHRSSVAAAGPTSGCSSAMCSALPYHAGLYPTFVPPLIPMPLAALPWRGLPAARGPPRPALPLCCAAAALLLCKCSTSTPLNVSPPRCSLSSLNATLCQAFCCRLEMRILYSVAF